ncbi:MAG: YitT family protein, partial [Clostridia bacterium]|nr:YitT family protein [Clostridia bacterium]
MNLLKSLKTKNILVSLLGSMILAFGLYNIHSISAVTEGGVLGLSLLLDHWLELSPALSGLVLNALCYLLGWKLLGKQFLAYSAIAAGGFSVFYRILEWFPPLYPQIADHPLLAAVLGACFVGVGVGLCVRMGGAPTGDDALAMSLSSAIKCKIQWVYLISDLSVLALSAPVG